MHNMMQTVHGRKSQEKKSDIDRRKSSRIKQIPKKTSELKAWLKEPTKINHTIYKKQDFLKIIKKFTKILGRIIVYTKKL